jgi:hypothetical protein
MQINGFEIEEYNIYNIPEGATRWTCPVCSHTRKKSNEKCMSVFWDTGLGQCNHCGARVQLHTYKKKTRDKPYVRPQNINTTNLSDKVVKWFESRGISQQTLKNARISDCVTNMPTKNGVKKRTAIMFNYYLDGELINVKYRDAEKNFKLISGAEKIFYNIDNIRTSKICVVTEGEIDCLSFMEVGIMDVVSIPNGSSLKSVNLDYLDSAIEYFDNKDWIYLALDTDAPGLNTRKEFIRRLGAERCKIIEFGEYKDANEVLMNLGAQALRDCFDNAKEVPIENVSSLRDWEKDYDDFLVNGMSGGYKIGKPYFDDIFSTYTGQFITVTGIPSCVTGDTEVLMRDGSTKQIKDIIIGDEIVSISKEYKAENDVVINKWNSGIKDVYELKLQSGKTIKATKEHGFLSFDGWRRFKNINIGDFIAVKNNVEFDSNTINAEGNKNHNSFYFSSSLEELILDVKDICRRNGLRYENNTELINKTSNNVRWEQVVGITYLGKVETYDIEVKKNHNFIANEIVVHNSGKSDWVDEMCIGYNKEYGWKIAYASPENKPNVIHASKIEAKLVGQWVKTKEQINTGWHQKAKKFIDDNFKFIDLEKYSLTSVLEKAKALIRKFGIKVLVIDPYNKIRLIESLNKSITDYTNDYLATIDEFARVNDILVILVAHPRKPEKGEKNYEPSFYDIKGGGEFFDMSPHGLLVHRDFELNMVKVKVLKCKFAHLGENNAHCWFKWNRDNGRFSMYKNHNEDPMLCSSLIEDNSNIFAEMERKSQSDLPFEPINDLPF